MTRIDDQFSMIHREAALGFSPTMTGDAMLLQHRKHVMSKIGRLLRDSRRSYDGKAQINCKIKETASKHREILNVAEKTDSADGLCKHEQVRQVMSGGPGVTSETRTTNFGQTLDLRRLKGQPLAKAAAEMAAIRPESRRSSTRQESRNHG
jgi:hypothetical protein